MPRVDPRQGLVPSVLDRLIDADEGGTHRQGFDLQHIVDSVRRDLEDLLNNHQVYYENLDDWPELSRSLLTYGIPDLTSLALATEADRQGVCKLLEGVIERFEPRLRNVRARLLEGGSDKDPNLRFQVEARINVDPAPEIAFETVLELISGRTTIKPSESSA